MSNPKISVIIPIYNVEDYLEDTLDSILNQTILDDIEVLMIDDGSTDNSRYIIERYALDYENFFAFHKENNGQGVARNFGLKHAKGEYIHFLDSDDIIIPDSYEKLYDVVNRGNYDFIVANVLRFDRYNCKNEKLFKNSLHGLKENTKLSGLDNHPQLVWDSIACNKLIKKQFLEEKNIKFLEKKIYFEDLLFSMECYCKSESFVFLDYYFYYWRLRTNSSSVTQNNQDIKNFKDRLEIIRLIKDLIIKYDFKDSTVNVLYEKWLSHDLLLFIKKIENYPLDSIDNLLDEILDIISSIPMELKENLNSYSKVVYKMIEKKDVGSLLYFAPLQNKLKKNPDMRLNLNQEYLSLINFTEDSVNEELSVKKTGVVHNDKNIFIEFEAKINYLSSKLSHKVNAILIDENDQEYDLEIMGNQIIVPFDLIMDKHSLKIKIKYYYDSYCKESYLINTRRQSIIFNNFDFEFGIGLNKIFFINIRKINTDLICIDNIDYADGSFVFEGKSKHRFDCVIIENVIFLEKISYPVIFKNDDFSFTIPYSDIISSPIRKWELKSDYLMELPKKFTFFESRIEIYFANTRNKILMSVDFYDNLERIFKLNNDLILSRRKIKKLKTRNSELSDEIKELKQLIHEFRSRKVVRFVDKFKR